MANAAITVDLNARIAQFETEMKRATGSLDKFGNRGAAVAAGMKSAFGALAGVLSVTALASFAKSGIDAADALNDMSQRLGVSVKDLASFKLAAEQSGTSLDGVGTGIARLTRSIGEAEGGNKKLAATLSELGITARDPKEAFFQLADAVKTIEDPSKRAALLSQVLGKSYQDLIPLLAQGGDELRKSAKESESFADAMARLAPDADRLNDSLALLKSNAAGAAAHGLIPLVSAINEIVARFQAGTTAAGGFWAAAAIGLKYSFDTPGEGLENLGKRFVVLNKQLDIAKEKGNTRTIANLEEERTQILREVKYLNAIKAAQQPAPDKPKAHIGGAADITFPTPKAAKTTKAARSATDPLASLLSQTDTAKAAEYEKLQGLLNARFERGAVSGKQYAEALTNLRNSYFSEDLKAFNDQLAYNAETERLTAEHLKGTTDALREQAAAWSDAGAALTDEMRTPLENANIEFGRLQELLDRGAISWETYSRAIFNASEDLDGYAKKTDGVKDAFKDSFDQMGNALSNFVTTGKLDFKSLVKDILAGLAKIALQKAIAGIAGSLFGGGGGGVVPSAKGNVFNSAGLSAYSGSIVSSPTVFPFAKGVGLMGEAGPEAIIPLRRGKDGKLGVASSGGGGGGVMINVSVDATGSKVEGDQGKSSQMGRMIGNAVRGVLVQEMRPGGMLA